MNSGSGRPEFAALSPTRYATWTDCRSEPQFLNLHNKDNHTRAHAPQRFARAE